MLRGIVAFSIRFRALVIVLALLFAAYGLIVAQRAKLDVFPEFAPPQIVVQTEAPGFSAEEVETLVTQPIEYSLNGTPELQKIYAQRGFEVFPGSPAQLSELMRNEIPRWTAIIKSSGAKVE